MRRTSPILHQPDCVISATWLEAFLQYLAVERRYSPNTIQACRRDVLCLPVPLALLQLPQLKICLAQHHARGLAPRSLARMASSWRSFFAYAHKQGWVQHNPCVGLKTPKASKPLPKAASVDALAALLSQPWSERFELMQAQVLVELLYCTGLRIAEALSIHLGEHWQPGASELRVLGKGNKTRVVPVIARLGQTLDAFLSRRSIQMAALGLPSPQATPVRFLWLGRKGQALGVRQAQLDVAQLGRLHGLELHLHPHMLRHSFGSHVLQSTQNLRAVQELLGHASIASTQVYTALDFAHLSAVYDKAFPRA